MATVYPVVEGWTVSDTRDSGQTGVKVFVDAANAAAPVNLPVLGEAFSSEFPALLCSGVTYTYLPGDGSCGRRYTVQYGSATIDQQDPEDSDDLPMSLSVAANIRSFETEGNWYWNSDSDKIDADVSVPVRDWQLSIDIQRWVYSTKLDDFNSVVLGLVGTINTATWRGLPAETVMFVGCEAQEYPTNTSGKRWLARLRFLARKESWQKIYRAETGTWDAPSLNPGDGGSLYTKGSFDTLFSTLKAPPDLV